jgi:hypothetical protein
MCEGKDASRKSVVGRKSASRALARRRPKLQRLASLALIAAACTSNPPSTTTTPVTSTVPSTTGVQTRWVWGIDTVELGGGYSLGPCDGDADQIACITKDGSVIGSAEHLEFPVDTFVLLDGVADPVESVELIAADYVATFLADRRATCPDLEFRALAPAPVAVGGAPGLRYGFEELDGSEVVETNIVYGVRVDETIDLYGFAAIAEGACLSNEGELTEPVTLDRVLPALDQAMAVVESG